MRACRNSNATTDLSFVMGAHQLTTNNTQREVINNIEFNDRDRIDRNNGAGEHLGVYQVMQTSPRQKGYFQEWKIMRGGKASAELPMSQSKHLNQKSVFLLN